MNNSQLRLAFKNSPDFQVNLDKCNKKKRVVSTPISYKCFSRPRTISKQFLTQIKKKYKALRTDFSKNEENFRGLELPTQSSVIGEHLRNIDSKSRNTQSTSSAQRKAYGFPKKKPPLKKKFNTRNPL